MFCAVLFLLSLVAASLAYPASPEAERRLADPLAEVSEVLDRVAREIGSSQPAPGTPKWSPLHRAVLRGALQVTKQLLGYEGWTPGHLELLKGEHEVLLEHEEGGSEAGGASDDNHEEPAPQDQAAKTE